MIEETIKIPEPIMDPETNNVASRRLRDFLSFVCDIACLSISVAVQRDGLKCL
jgi:hypothetical protein